VEGTPEAAAAVYFLTIDKCKFRKPVMPGDTVEYHIEKASAAARPCGGFTATPRSQGVTVAEADIGAMLDGLTARTWSCFRLG